MTAITLTEADRVGTEYNPSLKGYWVAGFVEQDGLIHTHYKIDGDKIKIAEPEKPPGMVRVKHINEGWEAWAVKITKSGYGMYLKLLFDHHDHIGNVTVCVFEIVPNKFNDPTLAAAIRAAQEGK